MPLGHSQPRAHSCYEPAPQILTVPQGHAVRVVSMNSSAPPSLPPAHFAGSTSVRGGIPIVFVKPRSLRVIGRMRDFEHGVQGIAASSGEADQGGVALSCRRHVFGRNWRDYLGRARRRSPRGIVRVGVCCSLI